MFCCLPPVPLLRSAQFGGPDSSIIWVHVAHSFRAGACCSLAPQRHGGGGGGEISDESCSGGGASSDRVGGGCGVGGEVVVLVRVAALMILFVR